MLLPAAVISTELKSVFLYYLRKDFVSYLTNAIFMRANIYIQMATHAVDKLGASIISHCFIQFLIWELPTLV